MKKIKFCILFVIAMFTQLQMMANDVYLMTTYARGKVAVWSWSNDGDGAWSDWMTPVSDDFWNCWFKTTINDSHNMVIFVFFTSERSTPDWDLNIYDYEFQTIDLPYSPQKAYFVLNSTSGNLYSGTYKWDDITIQSGFVPAITHSVQLSISGNGDGSISLYEGGSIISSGRNISEAIEENSNIRFVLTVNDNSFFRQWSDGDTTLDRSMQLTKDVSLQAEVVKKHHVVLDTDGNGTVTGEGYYADESVTITANPNDGYVFDHWSDNNRENPRTLNVTSDSTLTAYFVESKVITHSVQLSITGNGDGTITLYEGNKVISSGKNISKALEENSNIRFVLSVDNNSFFRQWNDGDTTLDRSMQLTNDVSLQAEVVKKHHVVLKTDGNGTVTGEGYYADGNVVITAIPNDGYIFDHWSDNNTDNPRTLNVTTDITLTAYFLELNILEPCQPANGDGTKNNEYKITQACELLWYALNYQSGDYAILDADISLDNVAWEPIGSKEKPYNAHIDGRNHYISDFTVVADTAGLFGYAKNADIRNIKVRDASVTGTQFTGIICGYATRTDIIACDNWAVVNGQMRTGGICGYLDNATISNCLNEGAVNATGDHTGGVAGKLNSAIVENCINRKSVSSQADYVGGIVGGIDGTSSSITTCSSSVDATVKGKNYVGGLCGNVAQGSIMTESINEGAVYATDKECGGLVGRFEGSVAKHLYNYGFVESSSSQVGGVMGSSKNNSTLESCVNTGTVIATQDRHVGGIIGDASQTSITASINIGQIQGKDLTGGIAGYFYESSTMVCCANYGAISGASQIGGLTGESRAKMTKSFSTGYVKGSGSKIGGISGNLFQSQYSESCLYDNQMCPLENAFGAGSGDGEGVSTSELIGTISALSGSFRLLDNQTCNWIMDENGYPRPSTLADKAFAAAGASAIILADDDNADNFSHTATLTKVNNAKWTSKGGTQINGTIANPSVLGQDELYVTKGSFVKMVPINITRTESIDNVEFDCSKSKFFRDGNVYILRGDKIYTLTGQEVK